MKIYTPVFIEVIVYLLFYYYYYFFLLYNIVLVLPYINMNTPRVYMCSLSWTAPYLPPHTIPLGNPNAPAPSFLLSCIEPGLEIHFLYDIIHVLMPS